MKLKECKNTIDKISISREDPWQSLCDVAIAINNATLSIDDILNVLVNAAISLTDACRGTLTLVKEDGELSPRLTLESEKSSLQKHFDIEIVGKSINSNSTIRFPDKHQDKAEIETSPYLCVPLRITLRTENYLERSRRKISLPTIHKVIGALCLDKAESAPPFTDNDLLLLQTLSEFATSALINASYYNIAVTDPVTGAYSRFFYEQKADEEFALAEETGTPLSLMLLDVDDFKTVNKNIGWRKGNTVLKEIVSVIKKTIRNIDFCAHYGGAEYIVLLPQTSKEGAVKVADNILKALSEYSFSCQVKLSVSAGISTFPDDARKRYQLTGCADRALARAKNKGSNERHSWNNELDGDVKRKDRLAGIITGNISKDYSNVLYLLELINAFNQSSSEDELFNLIPEMINTITDSDNCSLYLNSRNTDSADISYRFSIDPERDVSEYEDKLIKEVSEREGLFFLNKDLCSSPRKKQPSEITPHNFVMSVPLNLKQFNGPGVLYVERDGYSYEDSQFSFFKIVSALASNGIDRITAQKKLEEDVEFLREEVGSLFKFESIIGQSQPMKNLYRYLMKIVESDETVLIQGSTGTGKELIAKAIHHNSRRKDKRFVIIDCGTLPDKLAESELYGHRKGSFTDARENKKGLFEEAHEGTVFLDEIANMSKSLQVKLLRVLQEGEVRRIGDIEPRKIDVRILAASNVDLHSKVKTGEFRSDLYHRLNVASVTIPDLKDRMEDIPSLIYYFLEKYGKRPDGKTVSKISQDAIKAFMSYSYPGNIRELENAIKHAVLVADKNRIHFHNLPRDIIKEVGGDIKIDKKPPSTKEEFVKRKEELLEQCTVSFIETALRSARGNVAEASRITGMQRTYIYKLLKKYSIDPVSFR